MGSNRRALEISLERIRADEALNAWSYLAEGEARLMAAESDARLESGLSRSPIEGHLVALKGNIAVKGWPFEGGLLNRRGLVAMQDAPFVRRLRQAGAVLLGQTSMDVGALGAEGRSIDGPIRNPRRRTHSVGGSSGGSAAALAAGHVELAVGSDTVGSVRIPASFCGISSLKPSSNRIELDGVLPIHSDFDHVGPMTSRAALLQPLLSTLSGLPHSVVHSAKSVDKILSGRPMGFISDAAALGTTPKVLHYYHLGLDRLRSLGARLVAVELAPLDPARTRRAVFSLCQRAMAEQHRDGLTKTPELYSPEVRVMLEYGASLGLDKLQDFRARIWRFACAVQGVMRPLGALVLPTTPDQAFNFNRPTPTDLADLTVIATAAGLPAASVPLPTGDDLPAGLQIITAQGEDLLACELATRFESGA
ncbi:MAG: amidase [Gammaproteobacteria bacterium]|nr:amidase [Gammaproteobacteria bacterium]